MDKGNHLAKIQLNTLSFRRHYLLRDNMDQRRGIIFHGPGESGAVLQDKQMAEGVRRAGLRQRAYPLGRQQRRLGTGNAAVLDMITGIIALMKRHIPHLLPYSTLQWPDHI